jgi:hypothetical protein
LIVLVTKGVLKRQYFPEVGLLATSALIIYVMRIDIFIRSTVDNRIWPYSFGPCDIDRHAAA